MSQQAGAWYTHFLLQTLDFCEDALMRTDVQVPSGCMVRIQLLKGIVYPVAVESTKRTRSIHQQCTLLPGAATLEFVSFSSFFLSPFCRRAFIISLYIIMLLGVRQRGFV